MVRMEAIVAHKSGSGSREIINAESKARGGDLSQSSQLCVGCGRRQVSLGTTPVTCLEGAGRWM